MLSTATFNFPLVLKMKYFDLDSFNETLLALTKSASNFSSLFITQYISKGYLLANNKLLSSTKWETMQYSGVFLTSFM